MPPKPNISTTLTTATLRFLAAVIFILLSTGYATSIETVPVAQAGGEVGTDNATVDALFVEFDQPGSPGCGLAVARDGEVIYSRGYGYANLDYDVPITPQTVFDVASVNKQFVAASLSMLALEGKLSLDDNVRKWLPELPEYEWPITLRHMIYHISGLRDYLNLFPLAGRDDYFPISHPQILAMMSRQRALNFPPGERHQYSNTAYMLLAQVVERASGTTLGEFTRERIFEPLGMNGSLMYDDFEKIIPQRSIGYDRDGEGRLRIVHNYNFDVAGDGQLYTTMPDLLRWDAWLHGKPSPEICELMLTEGQLNSGESIGYAQGLVLGEYRGLRTVRHSGGSWGFLTQLVRFVEPKLSIAVSCNAGYAPTRRIAAQIADHYLADRLDPKVEEDHQQSEEDETSPPEPPTLTAEQMAEFTGVFFSPELDATYRFSKSDGGLVVRIEQEPPLDVAPVADNRFEFGFHPQGWSEPQSVSLEFVCGGSGEITGFKLSAGSVQGIVFERR